MRALLLHANKFKSGIIEESNWPDGIEPEHKNQDIDEMSDCLVCLFCVEKEDGRKQLDEFYKEIIKTTEEIKTSNLMISPFVHLSSNIAEPSISKNVYDELVDKFKDTEYNIKTSHFGYHKNLMLDVKGHPGSFRYREFN